MWWENWSLTHFSPIFILPENPIGCDGVDCYVLQHEQRKLPQKTKTPSGTNISLKKTVSSKDKKGATTSDPA